MLFALLPSKMGDDFERRAAAKHLGQRLALVSEWHGTFSIINFMRWIDSRGCVKNRMEIRNGDRIFNDFSAEVISGSASSALSKFQAAIGDREGISSRGGVCPQLMTTGLQIAARVQAKMTGD